ncbi:MAG: glycerophosphodiester phosphodiesterase family protein [candidate division KSB1 bacterium]|nr:glycerophosphodiester phosphodiesterase family protein [candidate division KSB1 bacterium]MDZ7303274.1 glycerophosphodiester phosphodiesterase family protein [candidate division KSB1 bacterium]MDZ7312578.1 glycerophosphodiester phosphodiesterase family protein [candidate division KSB1 bacterium]
MNLDQFFRCAHRGASGYAPENTLAAFRLAMEMGAEMCELDVQQTADDRLVVMHDNTLDRTTNGKGNVWEMTLAELQKYDAGSWFDPRFAGETLPSLEQVVELVRGEMKLNIEVKMHGHERNVAQLVVETLRHEKFVDECVVTSFDRSVADEIKSLAPELKAGYIFGWKEFSSEVFSGKVELLSAHYSLVDASFVERARIAGKSVHVWTVNEQALMRRLMELGVDGIITNYPDRLQAMSQE